MEVGGARARAGLVGVALALAMAVGLPAGAVAGERKQVDTDYTLVRSEPRSYVIATAYRGDTVDVQQEESQGYRWGRVGGGLDLCAWTSSAALPRSAPASQDLCSHNPPRKVEGFTNGQVGASPSGDDGAPARFTPAAPGCDAPGGGVPGYGNVKPWLTSAQPTDRLVNVALTAADQVRWRYVSKDGKWVMAHLPRFGDTDGTGTQSWMFVQRACLAW